MGDEPDYLLLDRYFAGECTPAEDAVLQRWIAERPDRRPRVEDLRAARRGIRLTPTPISGVDVDAEWAAFATKVAQSRSDRGSARAIAHSARARSVTAALVVIALAVGLSVHWVFHRTPFAGAAREYSAVAGQRLNVTLVDGTRFTLAPASKVRVAADYSRPAGARNVELEGEAYFAVAHDAAHPFTVRAHGVLARDVGTAFDVRAYPEGAAARVTVVEGVVAIGAACGGRCSVQVRAGDVATIGATGIAIEHEADVAALTAWTGGRLEFGATTLGAILPDLSRWLDLDVHAGDSALLAQPLEAGFRPGPADEVLHAVALAVHARVERRGRSVTLWPVANTRGRGHDK